MKAVKIGSKWVGPGYPTYVVAEIGINHNGDLDVARRLIETAAAAGCDAVKFQKRTVDVVYTPEELAKPRENPFGPTNGDLKRGLEFGEEQYRAIGEICTRHGLVWFASCWDEGSVDFMGRFEPPAYKIASASLTDDNLLRHHRKFGKPLIVSTGMSTLEQVDHALEVLGRDDVVLLHTTSTYPAQSSDLNLRVILALRERYGLPVGYSGHETGLAASVAAVALGAVMIERHITLDRKLWGSDQSASVEPNELRSLVEQIRAVESALGDGVKRVVDAEIPIMKKLRRVG
jgi:N-acetylneuraminate synthase